MSVPKDFLFTDEHIWVKMEGDQARIGLTKYAQLDIGDILLVELPEIGKQIREEEKFALIETAKAISDLKSPVSGKIIDINRTLEKKPELVNQAPYGDGWIILVQTEPSEKLDHLMDFKKYEAYLKQEGIKLKDP